MLVEVTTQWIVLGAAAGADVCVGVSDSVVVCWCVGMLVCLSVVVLVGRLRIG